MKKAFLTLLFLFLCQCDLLAQLEPWKLNAIGIDLGKNLPAWVFPNTYQDLTGIRSFLTVEPTIQITTSKPNRFLNFTVGFVKMEANTRDGRMIRNLDGGFVQLMREGQNESQNQFWGYGGFVTVMRGEGYINVKGDFFNDVRVPVPNFTGIGTGAKIQIGWISKISPQLRLRTVFNGSVNVSNIGKPHVTYLPGSGIIPVVIHPFSASYALNFQLFHLPKSKKTSQ